MAGRMAWREGRANPTKFAVAIISMAIGVGGMYAVNALTTGFSEHLAENARHWIAADITVLLRNSPTPEQLDALNKLDTNLRSTVLTETATTVSSDQAPDPVLVYLRVLDLKAYPFYGKLELKQADSAAEKLDADSVLVSEAALEALQVRPGDRIRVHSTEFRIAGVIQSEPGLSATVSTILPHIILSTEGLNRTAILRFGGSAFYQLLLKVPSGADGLALCARIETLFPESEVLHYTTAARLVGGQLDQVTDALNVLSIIFLAFGALGVAVAAYLHVLQRFESIAILRALGATAPQVLNIYLIQVIVLAFAASLFGIAIGRIAEGAGTAVAARYLDIRIQAEPRIGIMLQDILLATLAAGAATWLPLSKIRSIPASLLLRRDAEERQELAWSFLQGSQWGAGVVAAGLGLIVLLLIRFHAPWEMRLYFGAGLGASIAALFAVTRGAIAALHWAVRSAPVRLPFVIRHSARNLFRFRRQAQVVMLALASGAALGIVTFLLQKQVVTQLLDTSPIPGANLLFLNASPLQRQQLKDVLLDEKNIEVHPEWMPITWFTLVKAGGLSLAQLRAAHPLTWIQKTWLASCADSLPNSAQVVNGRWWPGDSTTSAAVEESTAQRLGLKVGSTLEFLRDTGPTQVRVTAILHVPPVQRMWNSIILGCSAFEKQDSAYYYGGMALKPSDLQRVRGAIRNRIPDLLTADASDLVRWSAHIGTESADAVRFCGILVLIAALCLLLGVTRALRFFRIHEVAVLRAIGARPRTVLAALVLEYAALGGLAGLIGVSLGSGATIAVLFFITGSLRWTFNTAGAVVLIIATAVIAGGVGLCGSRTLLDAPPLEVLRRR